MHGSLRSLQRLQNVSPPRHQQELERQQRAHSKMSTGGGLFVKKGEEVTRAMVAGTILGSANILLVRVSERINLR